MNHEEEQQPEDPNERYERLADEFYRATGMLAPGKDQAAAEGGFPAHEARAKRWNEWINTRRRHKVSESPRLSQTPRSTATMTAPTRS